jgi:hypothetical protein
MDIVTLTPPDLKAELWGWSTDPILIPIILRRCH